MAFSLISRKAIARGYAKLLDLRQEPKDYE